MSPFHLPLLPPSNKITCKNIQATLHADWNHPNPHDFAALDYIILPRDRGTTLLSAKSQPTWVFETKHFPVSFKIRVQDALPTPKSTSAPRWAPPDNKQKLSYLEAADAALFVAAGAPPPHGERTTDPGQEHVEGYTDGSCPNNRAVSPTNPAGWGYNLKLNTDTTWAREAHGPVNTAPDNPEAAGAEVGSNNTAEVQALIELFDDILVSLPTDTAVIIYTDSQYAHDAMRGISVPTTHIHDTYSPETLLGSKTEI